MGIPRGHPYGGVPMMVKLKFTTTFAIYTDAELNKVWDIVGKACDRNNIDTDGDQELSVRLYDIVAEDNDD